MNKEDGRMNKQEAIKIITKMKDEVCSVVPDEYVEAINMAIEALQFQDIMINNPKSAKPTPEVCKTCMDNKQDNWVSDDLVSISTVLEIFSDLYWFDEDSLVVSKKDIDKIYERLRQIEPCKDGDTECTR